MCGDGFSVVHPSFPCDVGLFVAFVAVVLVSCDLGFGLDGREVY